MAATTTPQGSGTGTSTTTRAPGPLLAAGVFMVLVGAFHAIEGVVALASDTFFEGGKSYWFQWNLTAWGWVHIAVGALVAVTGIFLMRSANWAATLALFLCSASILASFLWLPHYPVWSLALIVLDVFVIWAVTATGPPRGRRHEHEEEEAPAGYHTPPPPMTW
jgi:hypothetical protein